MMEQITISPYKLSDAGAIKSFCLEQIKLEYGYEYNPDWHADIDALTDDYGVYSNSKQGGFWIAKNDDEIIGTCGLRDLSSKTVMCELCYKKFGHKPYASLWRTYVKAEYRNKGIASELINLAEKKADEFNYERIYLHTSWNKPDSVKFWQNRGYEIFLKEDNEDKTVHMIKSDF